MCHCNYLISCPFGARRSTNLDPFLLQAAHASVLLDGFRHLNATISGVTPALTYHGNFLASITGSPRSLLPSQLSKTQTENLQEDWKIFHHHYYPSEFPLHHFRKLNGFVACSLSSYQEIAGPPGL